jgi:hypothetical protein
MRRSYSNFVWRSEFTPANTRSTPVEDRPAQLPVDFSTEIFAVEEVDVELRWISVYLGIPEQLDWSI